MAQPIPKQEYLDGLLARNRHNRQIVEDIYLPLDMETRSWQPEPGEWSIDQCFEHLILSFEGFLPRVTESLNRPEPPNADGLFRSSWWGRQLMSKLWDPERSYTTRKSYVPAVSSIPDVFARYLKQIDHLSVMIEQAAQADLQDKSRFHYLIYFNLGEHLNAFVSHDELHIEQARRVLVAMTKGLEAVPV